MEWIPYVVWALVIVWLSRQLLPVRGIKHIDATELKRIRSDRNKQWIDVRTKGEYAAYHLSPFQNIPLHELKKRSSELDKEKEVVLICQSGMRSQKAARILKKQGFQRITNDKGGLNACK